MIINANQKIISCQLSKYGLPTLTENGGGSTNTGHASIICSVKGGRKKPIYIPSKGSLSNSDHAFFVIKEGDIKVEVSHHNKEFDIKVYQVKFINLKNQEIILDLIEQYSENNFLEYQSSIYKEAIKNGINKSTTYNCTNPFFYYEDKNLVEKQKSIV